MSIDLLDVITKGLSGPLLGQLAGVIAANTDATSRGLAAAVPAILGGLLNSASTPTGASKLIDLMTKGNFESLLGNIGGLLTGGKATRDLMKSGTGLLSSILGDRSDAVTDALGSASGLNRASASSLLAIVAPLAIGFITRHLRGAAGLNPPALTSLLSSQEPAIAAATPAAVASALPGANLTDRLVAPAGAVVDAPHDTGNGTTKWIVGLAALAIAFFAFRSCQTP